MWQSYTRNIYALYFTEQNYQHYSIEICKKYTNTFIYNFFM